MKVLGLFSGIGGFELGLQRAGFEIAAMCEIDPYCRKVLRKHWPDVPIYEDVRELKGEDIPQVDVITGGFPCQDISHAGRGAGISGSRSGLWRDMARVIGLARPRYVIVENVAALLGRGLDVVLSDLAALGYDAEWHCIPAAAVGAPHIRDRIWIVAYPQHSDADRQRLHRARKHDGGSEPRHEQSRLSGPLGEILANAARFQPGRKEQRPEWERAGQGSEPEPVPDAGRAGCEDVQGGRQAERGDGDGAAGRRDRANGRLSPDANGEPMGRPSVARQEHCQWLPEPDVGRVAHGVPNRVDRLRALGNAVVPQIPEMIGRAILAAEAA